jgi:hypothetical protein
MSTRLRKWCCFLPRAAADVTRGGSGIVVLVDGVAHDAIKNIVKCFLRPDRRPAQFS